MVSSSERSLPPRAALMGSTSPMMSAMVTSGRGQFFDVSRLARQPGDRRIVAALGNQIAAGAADRPQRMIVNFAAGDVGNLRVEKLDQPAQNAALGLAAQSQQNKVVPRQNGVRDLRQHRLFIPVHAGKSGSRASSLRSRLARISSFTFRSACRTLPARRRHSPIVVALLDGFAPADPVAMGPQSSVHSINVPDQTRSDHCTKKASPFAKYSGYHE